MSALRGTLYMLDLPARRKSEEKSVFMVKQARKAIETGSLLLTNRISLLNQENLRSRKNTAEARKRAQEVYIQKIRKEEKLKEVCA